MPFLAEPNRRPSGLWYFAWAAVVGGLAVIGYGLYVSLTVADRFGAVACAVVVGYYARYLWSNIIENAELLLLRSDIAWRRS